METGNNGKKSADRDEKGRFIKGNKGGGKHPGSRHKTTVLLQGMLDGKAEQILEKAVAAALEGDSDMQKFLLGRAMPPRKDSPVKLTMGDRPAADILKAVGAGELTPGEAKLLADVVKATDMEAKIDQIIQRLESLEK